MPAKKIFRLGAKKFYGGDLGQIARDTMGSLVATYDFARDGGAVGSITLKDLDGNSATLPKGAVIRHGFISIITAMASAGGTGTIALTAQSAGDLKAAVDADTLSALVALIPVGTAASAIKLTADRTLVATVAVEALTAGKFDLVVNFDFTSQVDPE